MKHVTNAALIACLTFAVPDCVKADDTNVGGNAKTVASGVISGRVVDDAGKAIAGAKVNLLRFHFPSRRFGHLIPVASPTLSKESGEFEFTNLSDDYYVLNVKKTAFARALSSRSIEMGAVNSSAEVVLQPPVEVTIELMDESGTPVEGARIRHVYTRGKNGSFRIVQMFWNDLDLSIPPSDKAGKLVLPLFATGDSLKVTIDHPQLAPVQIDDLTVATGATVRAVMKPGIVLTFRRVSKREETRIPTAVIDLRSDKPGSASDMQQRELEFDDAGITRIAIEPGEYNFLRLQHENFYLTPTLTQESSKRDASHPLHFESGKNVEIAFEVHSKVKARGRVVDAETGQPVAGDSLLGELMSGDSGPFPQKSQMNFTDWTETNSNGEFEVTVAEGRARVQYHGDHRIAETDSIEFVAAPDGSTVIPDIKVRTIPKITGVVRHPDGRPAAQAVVRARGNWIGGANLAKVVLSDEQGRFELQPEYMPRNTETGARRPVCSVLAFDATRPLAAKVEARLDKPEPLEITLETRPFDWPLTVFPDEMTQWARGNVDPERAAENAKTSLRGKPAPELDCAAWINSEKLDWKALRGKYVLLDFWFVQCGPCREDMPTVKLAHDLFKDHGLVVIGVHNNSEPPEKVQKHATEFQMRFPIAVDQADGRTVASYQKHGIASGFPNYVLIGPDGNVLLDDRTIPHPALRLYKLEIVRNYLFNNSLTTRAASK